MTLQNMASAAILLTSPTLLCHHITGVCLSVCVTCMCVCVCVTCMHVCLCVCCRPSSSFSGPPPPGLQQPHRSPIPPPAAHMNFGMAPPGDRWNVPPSQFMGGGGGGGGRVPESHSMSFPNPPPSAFDLSNQNREARPPFNPRFGNQTPQPNSLANGPESGFVKGEWSRGVVQRDKFPYQNGAITFRTGGGHFMQGSPVLTDLAIHQQVKRMKTAHQK
jgi:hypothetical protein